MDEKIDRLIQSCGNKHRYQYFILFLVFILWINTCFVPVSIPFLEKTPDVTYIDSTGKNIQEAITYDICNKYNYTVIASEHLSWVNDFKIYCDPYKTGLIGSFIFIGNMGGALLFPVVSKIITHKTVVVVAIFFFALVILSTTLLQYYWFINIILVFIGIFANLCCYSSIVLIEEVVASSRRSIFGGIINIGFCFSGVSSVLLFLLFKNWIYVFYCLIGLSGFNFLLFFFFSYDSPRTFILEGNYEKTMEILHGIAKFNGKTKELEDSLAEPLNSEFLNSLKNKNKPEEITENSTPIKKQEITSTALFKYKSIRTKFLTLCVLWLCTSFVYNAISIGAKNLPGNIYQNIIILYLFEAVSYLLTGVLINIKVLGRKKTLFTMLMITVVSLLMLYFFDFGEIYEFIFVLLARFCVSGVYTAFYTYSLENYPTPVRTIGFGINATFGNIGGILAPMVIELITGKLIYICYAGILFINALLLFILKETVGLPMPETIDELVEKVEGKLIYNSDPENQDKQKE